MNCEQRRGLEWCHQNLGLPRPRVTGASRRYGPVFCAPVPVGPAEGRALTGSAHYFCETCQLQGSVWQMPVMFQDRFLERAGAPPFSF